MYHIANVQQILALALSRFYQSEPQPIEEVAIKTVTSICPSSIAHNTQNSYFFLPVLPIKLRQHAFLQNRKNHTDCLLIEINLLG
jgi:hypothetical protein